MVTEEHIEPSLRDNLNPSPEEFFEFRHETARKPRCRLWAHLDQEIDITLGASITAC